MQFSKQTTYFSDFLIYFVIGQNADFHTNKYESFTINYHQNDQNQQKEEFYQIRPKFKFAPYSVFEEQKTKEVSKDLREFLREKAEKQFMQGLNAKVETVVIKKGEKAKGTDQWFNFHIRGEDWYSKHPKAPKPSWIDKE